MEIGKAIEDETPGKASQFFKDPKNLATMLVLATALTSNRRQGQSALNKGLQSGLGALGFRGALDRGLNEQQRVDQEAQSVQDAREQQGQTATDRNEILRQQVLATQDRTNSQMIDSQLTREQRAALAEAERKFTGGQGDADRASRERIAGMRTTSGGDSLDGVVAGIYTQAHKDHNSAYQAWLEGGRQGPEPALDNYILDAHRMAAALRGTPAVEPRRGDPGGARGDGDPERAPRIISPQVRKVFLQRFGEQFGFEAQDESYQVDSDLIDKNIIAFENSVIARLKTDDYSAEDLKEWRAMFSIFDPETRALVQNAQRTQAEAAKKYTVYSKEEQRRQEKERNAWKEKPFRLGGR